MDYNSDPAPSLHKKCLEHTCNSSSKRKETRSLGFGDFQSAEENTSPRSGERLCLKAIMKSDG